MMRVRLLLLGALVGLPVLILPGSARAEQVRYQGQHPIPEARSGQFCYIGVPHTHSYRPPEDSLSEFRRTHLGVEFVGDPTARLYEGPAFAYKGHHPLHFDGPFEEDSGLCEVEDAHFHLLPPANPKDYKERSGNLIHRELGSSSRRTKRRAKKRSNRKRRGSASYTNLFDDTESTSAAESAPAAPTTPSENRKEVFRSWMDRRRGK